MNIKNLLDNLSDHERRMVTIAGIIVAVLLSYLLLWIPLTNAVTDYQHQVTTQQQLLSFLNNAVQKITLLKSQGVEISSSNENSSDLLTLTEKTLSSQSLSTYLKQVQEPSQDRIMLTFQDVPLDKLLLWLSQLNKMTSVDVLSFSATRGSQTGVANVTITLTG